MTIIVEFPNAHPIYRSPVILWKMGVSKIKPNLNKSGGEKKMGGGWIFIYFDILYVKFFIIFIIIRYVSPLHISPLSKSPFINIIRQQTNFGF